MAFDYSKLASIKNTKLCIYKITNAQNGKVYVGKTEVALIMRIRRHCCEVRKGTNRYLYDAIRHYGWDTFAVKVIEVCTTKEELDEREIFWITVLKSKDKRFGYNMTEGGDGGGFTPEALKKSADLRRGKPISDEVKKKISDGNRGKTNLISEETKRKISKTLVGRMPSKPIHEIMAGKPPARLGAKHTEASKKLMSLHQTGVPRWTEDQRKQMSVDRKGEGNAFWTDISKDELANGIKNGNSLQELSARLSISIPTVLSKIRYLLGFSGLREARKHLCEERDDGLETRSSKDQKH
jgi:group I intron endonuclease